MEPRGLLCWSMPTEGAPLSCPASLPARPPAPPQQVGVCALRPARRKHLCAARAKGEWASGRAGGWAGGRAAGRARGAVQLCTDGPERRRREPCRTCSPRPPLALPQLALPFPPAPLDVHPHQCSHALSPCIIPHAQGGGWQLVLLDHGLYRRLDHAFRLDYAGLWRSLIFGGKPAAPASAFLPLPSGGVKGSWLQLLPGRLSFSSLSGDGTVSGSYLIDGDLLSVTSREGLCVIAAQKRAGLPHIWAS